MICPDKPIQKISIAPMLIFSILLFLWENSLIVFANPIISDSTKVDEIYEEPAEIISMISLIANPEKYHGKILRVFGYLNLEFEGNAIYLHKEDCELMNSSNGLWVDIENNRKIFNKKTYDKYNHKYVFIQGTFDMNVKGHFGMWSGSIRKITSVDVMTMFKK